MSLPLGGVVCRLCWIRIAPVVVVLFVRFERGGRSVAHCLCCVHFVHCRSSSNYLSGLNLLDFRLLPFVVVLFLRFLRFLLEVFRGFRFLVWIEVLLLVVMTVLVRLIVPIVVLKFFLPGVFLF